MGGGNDGFQALGDDFIKINLADLTQSMHSQMAASMMPQRLRTMGPPRPSFGIMKDDNNLATNLSIPRAGDGHSPLYEELLIHSSAPRVDTDLVLTEAVRQAHPGSAVVVSRDYQLQALSFPAARFERIPKTELVSHRVFWAPGNRNDSGGLGLQVLFGCFSVSWEGHRFLAYIAQFTENVYMTIQQFFFVHDDEAVINQFILAASNYAYQLHDEIPIYAHGYWEKSHDLWVDVQKADWADVILDAKFKKRLQVDIDGFFKSEEIYKKLAIPWKRGIILLGPPGNGKTISIKAIMKASRNPSLLVRNFQSWAGDEYAMQLVFSYARRMSPCIVILEDLDSLINDNNRSYFLNELDGLANNDGLLVIGTTNHFERLDPALSNRPSRFDRKFSFDPPNWDERVLYARYWQKKLADNKNIDFPDKFVNEIANLTKNFSFAFIKEAMVSSLVILANSSDSDFQDVVKEQIKSLRETIDDGDKYGAKS